MPRTIATLFILWMLAAPAHAQQGPAAVSPFPRGLSGADAAG
jgi:hypothetical protein